MKQSGLERAVNFISTFASLILPVAQLGIFLIQDNPFLFLEKAAIIPTSVIALVISILVILVSYTFPFFRQPLDREHEAKYIDYLRKTDPAVITPKDSAKIPTVSKPIYLDHDILSVAAILVAALSGFFFTFIGLTIKNKEIIWVFLQSLSYLLFIVSTSYAIFHLVYRQYRLGKYKENRVSRAKRAVELAISHSAIKEVPTIRICNANEIAGFPGFLTVDIEVGNKYYKILSDPDATEFITITGPTNGRT